MRLEAVVDDTCIELMGLLGVRARTIQDMTPTRETRPKMLLDLLMVVSAMVAMARRSVIGERRGTIGIRGLWGLRAGGE